LVDAGWDDHKVVQPDGCGQARRRWKGGSYPLAGGGDDPLRKLGPPSDPPWFFQPWVPLTYIEPCIFRPRFCPSVTCNGPPPLCVTTPRAPLPARVRSSHVELPHLQRGLVSAEPLALKPFGRDMPVSAHARTSAADSVVWIASASAICHDFLSDWSVGEVTLPRPPHLGERPLQLALNRAWGCCRIEPLCRHRGGAGVRGCA
jgi:hypothetical protein